MKYIEYTYYYIIYLGRTGRNKSIYEYIGTSEREEEFPGYPMEKPRRELQEYPTYYHQLLWISEASIHTLRRLGEMTSPLLE